MGVARIGAQLRRPLQRARVLPRRQLGGLVQREHRRRHALAEVEEGIVVQTPAADSYEPEQRVVVTAPPERVYLFDIDSGQRLR